MSIYAYQLLKGLGISEARLLRVLPNIQVQSFDPNQVIFHKGSQPAAWSHVLSGLVSAGIPDSNGDIAPIHVMGPGTWFGESAFLNGQSMALECICLTPVRLLVMPIADAMDAFESEPKFAQYIAHLVAWRNQNHIEMLTLMRLGSPQLRVVMGLALFAEALHNSNSHLPTNELDDVQEIPLKQSLLASMCGVSRGIFSECVQHLSAAGWVRPNYATLALSRVPVWHKFSKNHRNNRHNNNKPSMPEILGLMTEASVS
jgi:CRP-like cAMP-binding protein